MHTTDDNPAARVSWATMFGIRNAGLLALFVFLLFRPYIGMQHDARLYVGYALAKLDPSGIGRDAMFMNDGQSGYSIFPWLLYLLVEQVGPAMAAMLVPLTGLLLWYLAFRSLVEAVLPRDWSAVQRHATILIAVVLSPFYGGTGVFRFAEPYATPRVFAEALVLITLALLVRGSRWYPMPLLAAFAVHPLMSAPSVGIVVWMRVRSWTWRASLLSLAILAVCAVAIVSAMMSPNRGVFARFDAPWLHILDIKESLVFLRHWSAKDFSRTALHALTVLLAWPVVERRAPTLAAAVLVASAFGVFATAVGADIAGNVLLTQGQLWRALWMLALLASVCVPILLHAAWAAPTQGDVDRRMQQAATWLLLLAWALAEISAGAAVLALLAGVLWTAPGRWPRLALPPIGVPVVGVVCILVLIGVLATQTWVATSVAWQSPDRTMRWNLNYWLLTGVPGLMVMLVATPLLLRVRPALAGRWCVPVTTLAVCLWISRFDSRTAYQRYLEAMLDRYMATGETLIPRSPRPLLWPSADIEAWAFAGSPSWAGGAQGVPAVFSRELSLIWYSRWRFLQSRGLVPQRDLGSHDAPPARIPTARDCPPSSDPADLILPADASGVPLAVPKLVQPGALGGSWTVQAAVVSVRCTP